MKTIKVYNLNDEVEEWVRVKEVLEVMYKMDSWDGFINREELKGRINGKV